MPSPNSNLILTLTLEAANAALEQQLAALQHSHDTLLQGEQERSSERARDAQYYALQANRNPEPNTYPNPKPNPNPNTTQCLPGEETTRRSRTGAAGMGGGGR